MTGYQTTQINGYDIEVYSTFDGDEVFIMKDSVLVYSARTCKGEGIQRAVEKTASPVSEMKERLTKSVRLAKARQVLESFHIQEVEVRYLTTLNDVRYYQARTWGGRHQYQVKFWDNDGRVGRCNCASLTVCRHLIRAAELDSELNNIDIRFDAFADYRAHQHMEVAA